MSALQQMLTDSSGAADDGQEDTEEQPGDGKDKQQEEDDDEEGAAAGKEEGTAAADGGGDEGGGDQDGDSGGSATGKEGPLMDDQEQEQAPVTVYSGDAGTVLRVDANGDVIVAGLSALQSRPPGAAVRVPQADAWRLLHKARLRASCHGHVVWAYSNTLKHLRHVQSFLF